MIITLFHTMGLWGFEAIRPFQFATVQFQIFMIKFVLTSHKYSVWTHRGAVVEEYVIYEFHPSGNRVEENSFVTRPFLSHDAMKNIMT